MARITADRLVKHLTASGFELMTPSTSRMLPLKAD
jgi:hypothetical protein